MKFVWSRLALILILAQMAGFKTTAMAAGGTVWAWGSGPTNVPANLTNIISIASASYTRLAVRSDGAIIAWGDDLGNDGVRNVPMQATNVAAIATGNGKCLALRKDGSLVGWGIFVPPESIPEKATGIVSMAIGGGHFLALREDGAIVAWGANNYGQCIIPVAATNVVAVAAGSTYSIALRKDGKIISWGGDKGVNWRPLLPEAINITAVSAGDTFNLALREDGKVFGWGWNWGAMSIPPAATNIVGICASDFAAFAITTNGSVISWGRSDVGPLNFPTGLQPAFEISSDSYSAMGLQVTGNVFFINQPRSRQVDAGSTVIFHAPVIGQLPISGQWRHDGVIMAGEISPVLLLPNVQPPDAGSYEFTASNAFGSITSQPANLTITPAKPFSVVNPKSQVVSIGANASFYARAAGTDPILYQWQKDDLTIPNANDVELTLTNLSLQDSGKYCLVASNALGVTISPAAQLTVVPVIAWGAYPQPAADGLITGEQYDLPEALTNAVELAAGKSHNLALLADGTAIAWGRNQFLQATLPADATNLVAVAADGDQSIVLRRDGTVRVFGNTALDSVPTNVFDVTAIAAGSSHFLALKRDRSVVAWGNYGNGQCIVPTHATNIVEIAAGWGCSLALRADGQVIGWGGNYYGESNPPAEAKNIISVVTSGAHTLGLREDGSVVGWGNNSSGQATPPEAATNIIALAIGADFSLALREDGRLFAWGDNSQNQATPPPQVEYPAAIAAGPAYGLALIGTGELRFLRQSSDREVLAGNRAALYAPAVGHGPIAYQWLRQGTNVPGATHAYLIFPNTQAADSDTYELLATNSLGGIRTGPIKFSVRPNAPFFTQSPTSQVATLGGQLWISTVARGTEPMAYQWRFNGEDLPDATNSVLSIPNLQWANMGNYEVVASNSVGVQACSTQVNFEPTIDGLGLTVDGVASIFAGQPDGKIYVGGGFNRIGGKLFPRLTRLLEDGRVDTGFHLDNKDFDFTSINSLTVQPDGNILVGGPGFRRQDISRYWLTRLLPDGQPDPTYSSTAGGYEDSVYTTMLLADGKILLGGSFVKLFGAMHANLVRLLPNGQLDETFLPHVPAGVYGIAVQADGKILLNSGTITRLNPDGTDDTSFPAISCVSPLVMARPNGSLLCLQSNPLEEYILQQLTPSGIGDESFDAGLNNGFACMNLLANGDLVMCGNRLVDVYNYAHIWSIDQHGHLESVLDAGVKQSYFNSTIQPDGRIVTGGAPLIRLNNPTTATQSLEFVETNIIWLRSGSCPEINWAIFQVASNGAWTTLGEASRIASGWQLVQPDLNSNVTIRARGLATGGDRNSATWLDGLSAGPPVIMEPQQSSPLTNNCGDTLFLEISTEGTPPLTYQWYKNGTNLVDHEYLTGAKRARLELHGVSGKDRGEYSITVSNTRGVVTQTIANLKVVDPFIISQPASVLTNLGSTASFYLSVTSGAPLELQWSKNGVEMPGQTNASLVFTNAEWENGGVYTVHLQNQYGSLFSSEATLGFPAKLDSLDGQVDGDIYAIALQPDGRILAGGDFKIPEIPSIHHLCRYNLDGTLDLSFTPEVDSAVYSIAVQPDGHILIGGSFSRVGGFGRSGLARLDINGTLDTQFNPDATGTIYSLAEQADGRIIVAGSATNFLGHPRRSIDRLLPDGTRDASFAGTADGDVLTVAIQSDEHILLGGRFTRLGGTTMPFLGRLTPDGLLDADFCPAATNPVYCLAEQPDGCILVGSLGYYQGSRPGQALSRRYRDGTLDAFFNPALQGYINTMELQADGKIWIGGGFYPGSNAGGTSYLGRLNSTGQWDSTWTFYMGDSPGIRALALETNSSLCIGGRFSSIQYQSRKSLTRLSNSYPAVDTLTSQGNAIFWIRQAASPEICRAWFDYSTNGTDWTFLGAANRGNGGWQLPGIQVPAHGTIRGRGNAVAGYQNGTSWMIEDSAGEPAISQQPISRTNLYGSVATFSALAAGTPPFSYQWYWNGQPLGLSNCPSASSAILMLTNVTLDHTGQYQAVISTSTSSVTSQVATLNVINPVISKPPASRTNIVGSFASFTVTANGTRPFAYQWLKDGARLTNSTRLQGCQESTLKLVNVTGADAGQYSVIVTNALGSVISSPAALVVLDPYIQKQPTNQVSNLGNTASFSVSVIGTPDVKYQWCRNATPIPKATNAILTLTNLQTVDAASFDVVVQNQFNCLTSSVAQLTLNLTENDPFAPELAWTNGSPRVNTIIQQTDGRILMGGKFILNHNPARTNLARFNADGSLDDDFQVSINGEVMALALQHDQKILVGGLFRQANGSSRTNICRLNPDGTVDPDFTTSADSAVSCLALQPDGKLLVGGAFWSLAASPRVGLGRLNSNGTIDDSFQGSTRAVGCIALQADGKILVGDGDWSGSFLERKNPDGTPDSTFKFSFDGGVYCIAVQPNGGVVVGGDFRQLNYKTARYLIRINPDGTMDPAFAPGVDNGVRSIVLQADGGMLVSGYFRQLGGLPRANLGRLKPDGSTDNGFAPNVDGSVEEVAVQADGQILLGGGFNSLNGESRNGIGRLKTPEAITQRLLSSDQGLTWQRSGTSPEFWRVTFQASMDGVIWDDLGFGMPIDGGWQLIWPTPSAQSLFRARGYLINSANNSSWYLESNIARALIQPRILLNDAKLGYHSRAFEFTCIGNHGFPLVIESTTNLLDWTPLYTNHMSSNSAAFQDSSSSNYLWRAYRLRQLKQP